MSGLLTKRIFQWIIIGALTGIAALGIILTAVGMFQTKGTNDSIAAGVGRDLSFWVNMPEDPVKSHMGFVFFGGIITLIASVVAFVLGAMSMVKLVKGDFEMGFIKFVVFAALGAFVFIFSVAVISCSNDLFDPYWTAAHISKEGIIYFATHLTRP